MYAVTTTGVNENYGKKDHRRLIANSYVRNAIKKGYIKPEVKYAGWGSTRLGIKEVDGEVK